MKAGKTNHREWINDEDDYYVLQLQRYTPGNSEEREEVRIRKERKDKMPAITPTTTATIRTMTRTATSIHTRKFRGARRGSEKQRWGPRRGQLHLYTPGNSEEREGGRMRKDRKDKMLATTSTTKATLDNQSNYEDHDEDHDEDNYIYTHPEIQSSWRRATRRRRPRRRPSTTWMGGCPHSLLERVWTGPKWIRPGLFSMFSFFILHYHYLLFLVYFWSNIFIFTHKANWF